MTKPPRQAVVEVRNLTLEFDTYRGPVRALNDISFDIFDGEIVGMVGESGCGKSVTSMALTRLLPEGRYRIASGHMRVFGRDPQAMSDGELQEMRGSLVSNIFQEPMNALNPTIRIGDQLVQVIRRHQSIGDREAKKLAEQLLDDMQIPESRRVMANYPFELSGGMRQRVLIAMAFSCNPRLLIADEPTTALDVTVQAQVLTLIKRKAMDSGTAVLFITHDMAVVSQLCDRLYVMYAGKIVESGITGNVLKFPRHPYTEALLRSLPERGEPKRPLAAIPGTVPGLLSLPSGCLFSPRCDKVRRACEAPPPTFPSPGPEPGDEDRQAACWLYDPNAAPTEAGQ